MPAPGSRPRRRFRGSVEVGSVGLDRSPIASADRLRCPARPPAIRGRRPLRPSPLFPEPATRRRPLPSPTDSPPNSVTLSFRSRLEAEVRELEEELHIHLPRQIKEAREHGDLSENAEYEAAKERQGYVAVRLAQLKKRLADLSMLNLDNIPADRASLGSEVVVLDLSADDEKKITYELVVSEEADAARGRVSTGSPIGQALMGSRVGDEVSVRTPAGERELEVLELRTIHDRGLR